MDNTDITTNNNIPQRPVFLTVLCVLTFISAAMGAFSAIVTPLFPADLFIDMINKTPFIVAEAKPNAIKLIEAGWGYYGFTFLFSVGSLVGAAMMWNLRKTGFHFYAISNLGLLFLPTLFVGLPESILSILLTLSFIGFYAMYLKLMK